MAYVAVNFFSMEESPLELKERIFDDEPRKAPNEIWNVPYANPGVETIGIGLPRGTIKKLIGRELTWNDEPVEIK